MEEIFFFFLDSFGQNLDHYFNSKTKISEEMKYSI